MRDKILVVEDDPDLLQLLSWHLKKAGFKVGTAKDGIEALKKARSLGPDLVLLDVMLPELDGLAVCEVLHRHEATALTPIIIISALGSQFAKAAALEAGAAGYVVKPFELKRLLATVRRVLDGKPGEGTRDLFGGWPFGEFGCSV